MRWRLLVVTLLLAATVFTALHWHQELDGQRCELCRVQQVPSLYTPFQSSIAILITQERRSIAAEIYRESDGDSLVLRGRAPPKSFLV